jgi:hypothetical protein
MRSRVCFDHQLCLTVRARALNERRLGYCGVVAPDRQSATGVRSGLLSSGASLCYKIVRVSPGNAERGFFFPGVF